MKHFPERLRLSLLTVAHKHLPDSDTAVFFCIPTCQRTIVGAFAYHRLTCNHVLHNSRIVRINSRFPSQTRRITNDLKYHQHRTISQCSISFCVPSIFLTLLIYMDESTDYPVEESKISKDCPKNFQNMKSSANLTTAVSLVTLWTFNRMKTITIHCNHTVLFCMSRWIIAKRKCKLPKHTEWKKTDAHTLRWKEIKVKELNEQKSKCEYRSEIRNPS